MKKRPQKVAFNKLTNIELKEAFDEEWSDEEKQTWKVEMSNRKHPLNGKYLRYLAEGVGPEGILKHPLLVRMCWPGKALLEEWVIERKEQRIAVLTEQGKWADIVWQHERQFWLPIFVKHSKNFNDKAYWKTLAVIWISQEQVWEQRKRYLELFQVQRKEKTSLMSVTDRRKLENLPNAFLIYRGFIGNRGVKGMSWTLDREKAIWFANRYAALEQLGKPKLAEATVKKKDILAYFNSRKEMEIVVDSERLIGAKVVQL